MFAFFIYYFLIFPKHSTQFETRTRFIPFRKTDIQLVVKVSKVVKRYIKIWYYCNNKFCKKPI